MVGGLAILLVVAAVLAAAAAVLRGLRAERAERRNLLADCVPLLDGGTIEQDAAGYGVLKGRYDGVEVALRPFAEALAFRRLPQLWLAATLRVPTDATGTLDILRRPTGCEFYSPGADLPRGFAPPSSWPQDTRVRASGDAGPLLARLEDVLARTLADDRTKNVTLTPRGLRLIVQHRQGERGAYLIYRDGRFREARVAPAEAVAALSAALSIARAANTLTSGQDVADDFVHAA